MLDFGNFDKKVIITLSVFVCVCGGVAFGRLYQPRYKTIRIYSQALENYQSKDYSNSYYLFSKVGRFSKLKPAALYRQAMSANALGDSTSELKSYNLLIKYFPNDRLANEAKYKAAQIMADSNPRRAKKYFEEVISSDIDEDYKIASEYYKSKIESENPNTKYEKSVIEDGFRQYLTKYYNGKLALQVAKNWEIYNQDMSSKDYTLVAKALVFGGLNNDASKILQRTDVKDSWAIQGLNSYLLGDNLKGSSFILVGVSKYADNVFKEDYKNAIDAYVKNTTNTYKSLSELLKVANGKNKDYVWYLKCKNAPKSEKYSCYENLYNAYPNGDYSQYAMINSITGNILGKNYAKALSIANDFITKYPESENLDMVMFWRAKIEQKYIFNPNYDVFYKSIINNFPDSYFAYRAFWIIQRMNSSVMNAELKYKAVEYPYKYPQKGSILYNLILVNDYDMISKYSADEFVKSWVQYKKGNYVSSIYTAQKAMDKLKSKPPKDDPRWRLVYPFNYYKQVENESGHFGNDMALIMSIIREESHFNPYAQSDAGAIGLMQLMPETAHEVGDKNGYSFNTADLFNPELNIKIGNLYYAQLKKILSGRDIPTVAAYNGGIGSVQKWKGSLQYTDIDEFVEQIPYEETKNYVYKVMKSYWNYTRIYQK